MKKLKKSTNYNLRTTNLLSGLSLVELLVGFAVLGLMALLVISIYFADFRLFSNQNTAIDVASQNKLALDEVTNQVRQSQSVVTTCTNCSGDTTGSQVLVLQLWTLNVSGEPADPITNNYDYIVYKRDASDNTKFIRKIVADGTSSRTSAEKLIATNISDLIFSYNNVDVTMATEVTVNLTTSAASLNKTHTTTQSAKALLRNK